MFKSSLILALSFASVSFAGTQVRLSRGTFDPATRVASMSVPGGESIVQFNNAITEGDKAAVRALGLEVLGYLPDDALVVSGKNVAAVQALKGVRAITAYEPSFKVSPGFGALSVFVGGRAERVLIQAFPGRSAEQIAQRMEKSDYVQIENVDGRFISAQVPAGLILAIAAIPGVEHVQPQPEFQTMEFKDDVVGQVGASGAGDYNDLSGDETGTRVMGFEAAWAAGLTGKGQIASMADTGLDTGDKNTISADFRDNLIEGQIFGLFGKSWEDPMGHGTHVAGSIQGRGLVSGSKIRGGAFEARFVPQSLWSPMLKGLSLPNKLADLFVKAQATGARVHSNSWGQAKNFGNYDSFAQQVDEFMFNNPDLLVVFAAGNSGLDMNKDGRIDPNSIGSPGTAKNCLTVGASENSTKLGGIQVPTSALKTAKDNWPAEPIWSSTMTDPNGIAMFSSRGPTTDKRLKPEIVAPGTNILSDRSHNPTAEALWGAYNADYAWSGGTSMATPLVSGAATITRQYLVERAGQASPSSALVKATLLHTAVDLYPGQFGEIGASKGQELLTHRPNNDEGYGRTDVSKLLGLQATVFVDEKTGVGTGETKGFDIDVKAGQGLLVNMVYNDAPGSPNAGAALVNDLDLSVTKPDGTKVASLDRINNHEIVELSALPAGRYHVEVKGEKVPQGRSGKQPFALVMTAR